MEQITLKEWAREQLRRAPSFTIALAILALILVISAFVEYATPLKRIESNYAVFNIERIFEPVIDKLEKSLTQKTTVRPVPQVQLPEIEPPEQDVTEPEQDNFNDDIAFSDSPAGPPDTPTEPVSEIIKSLSHISTEGSAGSLPAVVGQRIGAGKRKIINKYIGPTLGPQIEESIVSALRWFKNTQESDGSWDSRKWQGGGMSSECGTAMALLSFLGYGCTDKQPSEFASTVKKAMEYLVAKQNPDGTWGAAGGHRMYEQGIITMAMSEASAMMPRNTRIKEAAQKGIDMIAKVQGPDGGYGYTGPGNDNSVTIFQFQAMKAAIAAGLTVPSDFKKKTDNWLTMCVAGDGSTSYRPAPGQQGGGRDTMTAASLTARLLLGESRSAASAQAQAKWLVKNNYTKAGAPSANNIYCVYYLSLSMFQLGDEYWTNWRDAYMPTLMEKQETAGPTSGSWPTKTCQWGGSGGRIYTTAFACLSLEAAWRYQRK